MAADFLSRAGAGINIVASTIRFGQLDSGDWDGLASRVGHVRLCGDVAAALTNFSTCPATRWQPRINPIAEAHALLTTDPTFRLYKQAATDAMSRGLSVVLDPLHMGFGLALDSELLAAFWGAVLLEFDEVEYPPALVAFEMANEPGNAWGRHRVRGRLSSMYGSWVEQVHTHCMRSTHTTYANPPYMPCACASCTAGRPGASSTAESGAYFARRARRAVRKHAEAESAVFGAAACHPGRLGRKTSGSGRSTHSGGAEGHLNLGHHNPSSPKRKHVVVPLAKVGLRQSRSLLAVYHPVATASAVGTA